MSSHDLPSAGPGEARARLHGLLALTSRLSEPLPADEVARVVVDQAQAAVGALTAMMWTVDDPPTHATMVRSSGPIPQEALDIYRRIPLESWLPMADAMLRCEPFKHSFAVPQLRHAAACRILSSLKLPPHSV